MDNKEETLTASTSTWGADKYPDNVTRDLMRFVRGVSEEDALHNIPRILASYKKTIGWRELLTLLFTSI